MHTARRPHFLGPWDIVDGPKGSNAMWVSSIGSQDVPSRRVDLFNYRTKRIVAQVTVGSSPGGMATSPDRRTLWVADNGGSSVSIVNAVKRRLVGTIHVGASKSKTTRPVAVAVSHDGTRAFVACADGVLTVIETSTHKVRRQVKLSGQATSLAVSKNGRTAYVGIAVGPDQSNGTLDVVNLRVGRVTKKVAMPGGEPTAMVLSQSGARLFVTTDDYVLALSTATLRTVASYYLSSAYVPQSIALFNNGAGVYVALSGMHELLGMFRASNLAYEAGWSFPDFSELHDGMPTPDGKHVIATLRATNKVEVLRP